MSCPLLVLRSEQTLLILRSRNQGRRCRRRCYVAVNGTARSTINLIATRSNIRAVRIYPPVIQSSRLRRKKSSQKEAMWGGRLRILVAGPAANVSFPRDRQPDAVTRPRPRAARSSGPSTAGWPPAGSCRVAGITSPAGRSVERTGARVRRRGPTTIGDRRRSPRTSIAARPATVSYQESLCATYPQLDVRSCTSLI
jgi:hypothetical protein